MNCNWKPILTATLSVRYFDLLPFDSAHSASSPCSRPPTHNLWGALEGLPGESVGDSISRIGDDGYTYILAQGQEVSTIRSNRISPPEQAELVKYVRDTWLGLVIVLILVIQPHLGLKDLMQRLKSLGSANGDLFTVYCEHLLFWKSRYDPWSADIKRCRVHKSKVAEQPYL